MIAFMIKFFFLVSFHSLGLSKADTSENHDYSIFGLTSPNSITCVLNKRQLQTVSPGLLRALFILAIVLATLMFLLLVIVWCLRKEPIIAAATPTFCVTMIAGCMIEEAGVAMLGLSAGSSIFGNVLTEDVLKRACMSQMWLLNLGITLVIAPLMTKTYRIYKLFSNKSLSRTNLTNTRLVKYTCFFVLLDVLILLSWTFVDPPKLVLTEVDHLEFQRQCHSNSNYWLTTVIFFKVIILAITATLAFKARKVSTAYNESTGLFSLFFLISIYFYLFLLFKIQIGIFVSVYTIITMGTFATISFYLSGSSITFRVAVASFSTHIGLLVVLGSLFVPKFLLMQSHVRNKISNRAKPEDKDAQAVTQNREGLNFVSAKQERIEGQEGREEDFGIGKKVSIAILSILKCLGMRRSIKVTACNSSNEQGDGVNPENPETPTPYGVAKPLAYQQEFGLAGHTENLNGTHFSKRIGQSSLSVKKSIDENHQALCFQDLDFATQTKLRHLAWSLSTLLTGEQVEWLSSHQTSNFERKCEQDNKTNPPAEIEHGLVNSSQDTSLKGSCLTDVDRSSTTNPVDSANLDIKLVGSIIKALSLQLPHTPYISGAQKSPHDPKPDDIHASTNSYFILQQPNVGYPTIPEIEESKTPQEPFEQKPHILPLVAVHDVKSTATLPLSGSILHEQIRIAAQNDGPRFSDLSMR